MTLGQRGRIGFAVMVLVLSAPIGVLAFSSAAPTAAARASLPPLPRGERTRSPLAENWTRKSTRASALRVEIGALGAHTHDNWVFFRLPFDSTNSERVRDVQIVAGATVDPDVAAARVFDRCVPYKKFGPISTWATYTVGAIGPSLAVARHPAPPTDDPTVLALNVPTRVANYVSCGWANGDKLSAPETWFAEISWEER